MTQEAKEWQDQNRMLSEKAELLSLAEHISNLGTWEFFVTSQTIRWSEEMYRIYGFEKNGIVLTPELNAGVIAAEYKEKVEKEMRLAILNKSTFAVEYQIIQPDGNRKYVLGQGFYIEAEDKLVGTVQDITQQKEAILKLKINETLLRESELVSHSGSWEWLDDNEYVLWSDEMYNIHGFLPHSIFVNFQLYQGLVHQDDLQEFLSEFLTAREKKAPFKISYRIVRPSGEIRYVLSTAEYKKIGVNSFAYIGNTLDVTELRKAQVELEDKINALNRSNQDLEQFAYVASHDLQEPLRKIQAFGARLMTKYQGSLETEAQDYIHRMLGASERMRVLIDDLLTFSKATRGNESFTRVNLAGLIEETISALDFTIEQKKAVISTDVELELEAIPSQLMQLFQNLIGNALKFTDGYTAPKITITGFDCYGRDLDQVSALPNQLYGVVQITDQGIGFEDEDAEQIFDIFHRLHSMGAYTGTGIGLAICKKIADNHSGFIYASSSLGNGARFTVALPKKQIK
ncbi:MAG: PAS domain-containing protein [Bacteroidota bacterium]